MKLHRFQRGALLGAFFFAIQSGIQAAPAPKQALDSYKSMCMGAVDMPKPFGEWDLKDNAKLAPYCECFAEKFGERAMAESEAIRKNGGKPLKRSLEESNKQELALRNACRQKTGLPAAVDPN